MSQPVSLPSQARPRRWHPYRRLRFLPSLFGQFATVPTDATELSLPNPPTSAITFNNTAMRL
jgi:hypothetical protein